MRRPITNCWHSRKAQLNIFLGAKNDFTAATAFSRTFQLIFLLSLFVVNFVTKTSIMTGLKALLQRHHKYNGCFQLSSNGFPTI